MQKISRYKCSTENVTWWEVHMCKCKERCHPLSVFLAIWNEIVKLFLDVFAHYLEHSLFPLLHKHLSGEAYHVIKGILGEVYRS